jgi:uroporphyrinogen III methyltransferase/synthase
MNRGRVYLVGAGPGDPELLTLKGKRALESADVVLFDHLANDALLRHAPPHAERIYVGKKKSDHARSQDEIARLLIEQARAGKTVVRLKGGDPYLFGRGGEEVEALAAAGIPFEVVPGVTVPVGLAAYTGVPLTHRDHTSVVTFVTGHDPSHIDWRNVSGCETIVIFMGLTTLGEIAVRLIEAGRDPRTPAMAVRWATRPIQQTIVAPLADLAARVADAGMKPPATIVIGDVVSLRERLDWFEHLPLFGRRIVVTRAADQAGVLTKLLTEAGAEAIELPVIALEPVEDASALLRMSSYDWLVFTSANGVRFFVEAMDRLGADIRRWPPRVAAIGPATAEAIERLHVKVDVVPESFVAEGLAAAFERFEMTGRKVLLARASEGRDVVPEALRQRGARVDIVETYRNVIPAAAPAQAREVFAHKPDWVTFTSGSTVKNLLSMIDRAALAGVRFASIGPATSEVMRKHGLNVDAEAEPHTIEGLVRSLILRT